jgi:hypothetical protein
LLLELIENDPITLWSDNHKAIGFVIQVQINNILSSSENTNSSTTTTTTNYANEDSSISANKAISSKDFIVRKHYRRDMYSNLWESKESQQWLIGYI